MQPIPPMEFSSRHVITSLRPQLPSSRFVAIPDVICLPTAYQGCPQSSLETELKPFDGGQTWLRVPKDEPCELWFEVKEVLPH